MGARKTAIFLFYAGNTLLEQVWSKNQNSQFKLKFGTKTNSNMHNSIVMFIFSRFPPEIPFLGKFGPKNQNCQFKLKFGTKISLNMKSSIMVLTFAVLNGKYSFWVNLVTKFKIVSLR